MGDGKNVEVVSKAFMASGITGKFILGIIGIVIMFLVVFVWNNIQQTKLLTEFTKQGNSIEKMIEDQVKIDLFRRCVKNAYDETEYVLNNELFKVLGATLQENGIVFPQELNETISKYRTSLKKINDCLIFPEDVK